MGDNITMSNSFKNVFISSKNGKEKHPFRIPTTSIFLVDDFLPPHPTPNDPYTLT